jgi:hypothetical protein
MQNESMKTIRLLAVTVGTVFLFGCAANRSGLVLNTVGPSPLQPEVGSSTNGTLLVYSAYVVSPDFNLRDPDRQECSDYRILSADGHLLQRVHNNTGTIFQNPAPVALPPGKYEVIARANGYGNVTIPVMVEARKVTVLHLEGGASWSNRSVFNQSNAVRLPDDRIVGWKAEASL